MTNHPTNPEAPKTDVMPEKNMKRIAMLAIAMLVGCTTWSAEVKSSVPELKKGDVLLCAEYPYRTVKNTSRTVYQLARLGFTNVTSFQDAHGLKTDGIIGPSTQQKVESEFNKQFNVNPQKYAELNMLSLSVSSKLTDSKIAVTVSMRNESDDPLRIVGRITYNPDASFLFVDPTLSLISKVCTRNGGLIGCGSGPSAEVVICAKGTTITSSEQVAFTVSLLKMNPNQSDRLRIGTEYIDSTLSTGTVNAGYMIPKKEETKDGITNN
jgi:hypothetical protein